MKKILIIMLVAWGVLLAQAGLITVTANINDRTWRTDASAIWVGQKSAAVGYDATFREQAHILPFALPTIPAGEVILSANLKIGVTDSQYGNPLTVDLYGVRVNSSSTTLASDFYAGAYGSGAQGTAIQQAYALKADGTGGGGIGPSPRVINSSVAGSAALANWLNSLYGNGAAAGDFAFLRLNVDTDYTAGSNSYLYMYTGNSTAFGDITGGTAEIFQLPVLEITTGAIPEPATIGMIGVGVIITMLLRRIKF